ncbi:MAG TPA: hypothetical protein VMW66_06205 [Elusimicrobiales bacterium]|nr:hypothetical protein [Elusimicrobiales bacterium]
MEQEKQKQNGLITLCISWGKVLTFTISLLVLLGFAWGFMSWANRTSDNSAKIPQINEKVITIEKNIVEINTKQDAFEKVQDVMVNDIKKILEKL